MSGPLDGLRVVEMAGIGPGPFCGMMLADLGADVVCIERHGTVRDATDVTARGKRHVALDLQHADGIESALATPSTRSWCTAA
jgi:alpha-methylacyl-CoA racemase